MSCATRILPSMWPLTTDDQPVTYFPNSVRLLTRRTLRAQVFVSGLYNWLLGTKQ